VVQARPGAAEDGHTDEPGGDTVTAAVN
jgi:hypothetical protein